MSITAVRVSVLAVSILASSVSADPARIEGSCIQSKLASLEAGANGVNRTSELQKVRPRTVSVFAVLPSSDAEYAKLYGHDAKLTASVKKDFDSARERVKSLGAEYVKIDFDGSSPKSFDAFAERSKGQIAVILGHNDNGKFKFLNGEYRDVAEMAEKCEAHDGFCIFLTCEAKSLLAGRACSAGANCMLSVNQASKALEAVTAHIAAGETLTVDAVSAKIEAGVNAEQRHVQVKNVVKAGVVIGLVYVIYEASASDQGSGAGEPPKR